MSFYEALAFWSQIVSFFLFAGIFVWAWMKFFVPAIGAAQKASNERIAAAERHRDEMQAALAVLRQQIEGAKRDADALRDRAAELAKHETQKTLAEAASAGERAVRNAEGELARARAAAQTRFRDRLAERALELAKQQAQSRVDASTNAKLVGDFVASLDRGARN